MENKVAKQTGIVCELGHFGLQGYRGTMEDAHDVQERFLVNGTDYSFAAVYDGHGGRESAEFCQEHMLTMLK